VLPCHALRRGRLWRERSRAACRWSGYCGLFRRTSISSPNRSGAICGQSAGKTDVTFDSCSFGPRAATTAAEGGLLSYGPRVLLVYRHVVTLVDKILRGAKPADLPIEQPTKFELAVNLNTAIAIGITIPPTLLLRADEVIE
jgi:ABC transporter substrate binding protein